MKFLQRLKEWFKGLFKQSEPVQATPVPTLPEKPPVEVVLQPKVPVLIPPAELVQAQAPQPTMTDLLFRPTAEIGAILDSRVGDGTGSPSGVVPNPEPWPTYWVLGEQKRVVVNAVAGQNYVIAFDNPGSEQVSGRSGLMITPTPNDPAGQSANYMAILWGQNGPMWYDMGWVIPQPHTANYEFAVGPYVGPAWLPHLRSGLHAFMFKSDKDTQIFLDFRPIKQ